MRNERNQPSELLPTDPEDRLGGRLPLVDEAGLDPDQRQVWDHLMHTQVTEATHAGFAARTDALKFIGPFNAFLHWPGPSTALLDWAAAQARTNVLAALTRHVVILTVGSLWKAPFEVEAHISGARAEGLGTEAIDAVLAGHDHHSLSPEARIARQLASSLLVEHVIPDALYAHAVEIFGTDGVQAVAHLVGQYVTISALLIAFDVPAVGTTVAP